MLVPASTLRLLLELHGTLSLVCAGFGMEPWIVDGLTVTVEATREARPGDIVLCEIEGWGDLLRLWRNLPAGGREVCLDTFPYRRAVVSERQILGVLRVAGQRARRPSGRIAAALGMAALRFEWRRVRQAPHFGTRGTASVGDKYRDQVAEYRAMRVSNLEDRHIDVLRRRVPPGGTVLVVGCGAGGEVVHLARLGWRVTGIDLLPEMVDAARAVTAEAGVSVELLVVDVRKLHLPGRRFDAIYMTPLLYSFIPGRQTRIATLRGLRRHLAPGGALLFGAEMRRAPIERVQTILAWIRLRLSGARDVERGDWYTWYLTRSGDVGYSYLHRFTRNEAAREARSAGFARIEWVGAHLLASEETPG